MVVTLDLSHVIRTCRNRRDNNAMHAKPDLRVVSKWKIACSGSVIADVIRLTMNPDFFELPDRLARYLNGGAMTIRHVAKKYVDELGDNPTGVKETFERLMPEIQHQLIELTNSPISEWYDSYFGGVLPNYTEPPEFVFSHAESDDEPPYSAKLVMRKRDGTLQKEMLNDNHPAGIGFIALRNYLKDRGD